MSKATTLQKQLWKAYGKVAKTLGAHEYEVYRSAVLDQPIQDANVIDTRLVSFSKDTKYNKPDTSGKSSWMCWIDGRFEGLFDVQKGDYLYSESSGDTYYIASASDHMYIQAVKANDTITITRTGYGDSGSGFSSNAVTTVGSSIPCDILQPSSGGGSGYIPAATSSTDALPKYEIYVADTYNEVQIRDLVTDQNGAESQVLAIYSDDLGSKLITQQVAP